jgi:hypothetical protein
LTRLHERLSRLLKLAEELPHALVRLRGLAVGIAREPLTMLPHERGPLL